MLILATNWGHVTMITILGFLMVFLLLVVLIFILKLFGFIMQPRVKVSKSTPVKDAKIVKQNVGTADNDDWHEVNLPANATAAIAMALHLYYNDMHDQESTKITIKKVDRRYSPWNSKLYGMNNLQR
ncbi:MAG: OadG family protein [Paludibacter sp.]|nr:OadG family protein [Bacteroidales bacterium]MCM1068837.1 OadG family protein [Prevotella sp.]MCM1353098.1 OadG family protein [Bacteroides sp.]MCM1442420.1 OadG family protein [Muribaculum sp.]MCM1481263.1 OadG family protein [Paludibacter sp.]